MEIEDLDLSVLGRKEVDQNLRSLDLVLYGKDRRKPLTQIEGGSLLKHLDVQIDHKLLDLGLTDAARKELLDHVRVAEHF